MNSGLVPSTFFRGANNEAATTIPKAYINYLLFDEQFKCVGGNFSRVGASGSVKKHWYTDISQLQNIPITKNGYIFVYVSNESNINVFFDNLQVIHKPGPIVEETHYYPFGLTMAGISSKAWNGIAENKKKFNDGTELQSKEFSDGSGLDWYATTYRSYDAQIGRFHQIDPLAGIADDYSPYAYVLNNPLLYNDPYGLDTTRGNAPKPNPDPGDVWIPGKGPDQIFDADQGWTPNPVLQEVVVGGGSSNNDNSNNTSAPDWWSTTYKIVSTGVGTLGTYYGVEGYATHNEWWWRQKNGTWRWRTNVTKSNYLFNRSYKLKGNALTKVKALSTKLAIVNAGLIITDVAVNKQIKASHIVNGIMTGLSFTGVGSIISGAWFIADIGTEFFTGKSLSDRIDEAVGEPLVDWNNKKDD